MYCYVLKLSLIGLLEINVFSCWVIPTYVAILSKILCVVGLFGGRRLSLMSFKVCLLMHFQLKLKKRDRKKGWYGLFLQKEKNIYYFVGYTKYTFPIATCFLPPRLTELLWWHCQTTKHCLCLPFILLVLVKNYNAGRNWKSEKKKRRKGTWESTTWRRNGKSILIICY